MTYPFAGANQSAALYCVVLRVSADLCAAQKGRVNPQRKDIKTQALSMCIMRFFRAIHNVHSYRRVISILFRVLPRCCDTQHIEAGATESVTVRPFPTPAPPARHAR